MVVVVPLPMCGNFSAGKVYEIEIPGGYVTYNISRKRCPQVRICVWKAYDIRVQRDVDCPTELLIFKHVILQINSRN